jgi:hypothetical protein
MLDFRTARENIKGKLSFVRKRKINIENRISHSGEEKKLSLFGAQIAT